MNITIPDEILESAQMSTDDIKVELAILLYKQKKISIGQASHLAGMHLIQFQKEMANRGICINYDVEDFENDLISLREMGEL